MRKSDIRKIIETYSEYKDEYRLKNSQDKEVIFYLVDNPLTTLKLVENKGYVTVIHCEDGIYGNSDLWQIGKKSVKLLGITTRDDIKRESAELHKCRIENDKMYSENAILRGKIKELEKQAHESQNNKETETLSELKEKNEKLINKIEELKQRKNIKVGRKKVSEKIDIELFKRLVSEKTKPEDVMNRFEISRATYFRLKKEYCKD